jgi:2-hydroxychromene-2-carboxylate isomerase
MRIPFVLPTPFPFASVAACRAYYALVGDEPEAARNLAKALFDASFARGEDMSRAEGVLDTAAAIGLDRAALEAAIQDQSVKDRLRAEIEQSIEKGVFGSPFLIADGEAFWGHDKLSDLEAWLETGGW